MHTKTGYAQSSSLSTFLSPGPDSFVTSSVEVLVPMSAIRPVSTIGFLPIASCPDPVPSVENSERLRRDGLTAESLHFARLDLRCFFEPKQRTRQSGPHSDTASKRLRPRHDSDKGVSRETLPVIGSQSACFLTGCRRGSCAGHCASCHLLSTDGSSSSLLPAHSCAARCIFHVGLAKCPRARNVDVTDMASRLPVSTHGFSFDPRKT